MDRRFVQYGCGLHAPDGWLNFDASPRLRVERLPGVGALAGRLGKRLFPANVRYGDIVQGLPVAPNSVDGVYASHVLEHLGRKDAERAVANTFAMLKPGGIFRAIVPDLAWRARRYLEEREAGDTAAADRFIERCCIGEQERPSTMLGRLRAVIGNSQHRWMYDHQQFASLLAAAGFVDIAPCSVHDSGEPMFDAVERPGRFVDEGEPEVALQARKPA